MSLTSYRAAPSRAKVERDIVLREFVFLSRFGGDLLSHVLRRSTIGAAALNGRVRDGIGCFARAMTTKPRKKHGPGIPFGDARPHQRFVRCPCEVLDCDELGQKPCFCWLGSSLSGN